MALSYANGSVYAIGNYGIPYHFTALALPSATLTMPTTIPKAYDATVFGTNCASGGVKTFTMGGKIVISCYVSAFSTFSLSLPYTGYSPSSSSILLANL